MKTLEQIREEQQQLEEAAIRAYIIEGEKFAKALAAALGVTVVELTKSLGLSMAKNPVKSIIAQVAESSSSNVFPATAVLEARSVKFNWGLVSPWTKFIVSK